MPGLFELFLQLFSGVKYNVKLGQSKGREEEVELWPYKPRRSSPLWSLVDNLPPSDQVSLV